MKQADKYANWYTKAQAAQMIGTSERTLERMISKGEIHTAQRRIPGRKPMVVCDPGQVDKLAEEAAAPRAVPMPPESNTHAHPGALVHRTATPQAVLPALLSAMIPQADFRFRQVLTVEEAAGYTGFSETFLRRMVKEGKLRSVKDGRTKLFRADLDGLPTKLN